MSKKRKKSYPSNNQTEKALRAALGSEGKAILEPMKKIGETGPDIIVRDESDEIVVEVIPYKQNAVSRKQSFMCGLYTVLSRLDPQGRKKVALAMPQQFKDGLPKRIANACEYFARLSKACPELEFWFVDVRKKTYERYTIEEVVRKEGKL